MEYAALRTIGTVYKVLGVIAGIFTVVIALSLARSPFGLLGTLAALIFGSGIAITLYAGAEAIYLMLALEENTRLAAMLLQRQASPATPTGSSGSNAEVTRSVVTADASGRGGQVRPRE